MTFLKDELINLPITFYALTILILVHVLEASAEQQLSLLLSYNELLKAIIDQEGNVRDEYLILSYPLIFAIIKLLCWIPLLTTLLVWTIDWVSSRKRRCQHKLYDAFGHEISNTRASSAFLPDPNHTSEQTYEQVYQRLSIIANARHKQMAVSKDASWALVTGASCGIGRAIAIGLARRKIPLVLVARNLEPLVILSNQIRDCYGILAIPIVCDLTNDKSLGSLLAVLRDTPIGDDNDDDDDYEHLNDDTDSIADSNTSLKLIDRIDILINNAGLGDYHAFLSNPSSIQRTEQQLLLNVTGTTKLTQAIGKVMANRFKSNTNTNHSVNLMPRGGRIVLVSSIMGALSGVPNSAVYAATKAYQKSFSASLAREMEQAKLPIHVLCAMPGATSQTEFASRANMTQSAVWKLLPYCGLSLTPQNVSEAIVVAMLRGTSSQIYIGWMYILKGRILAKWLPDKGTMLLAEFVTQNVSAFDGVRGILRKLLGLRAKQSKEKKE